MKSGGVTKNGWNVLHALRVNRKIVPTRDILILKEVAEQANILELFLRVSESLGEGCHIVGTVDGTRNGKGCFECVV